MTKHFIHKTDIVTKALIILAVGWFVYGLSFFFIGPYLISGEELQTHSIMMGDHLMHYESQAHSTVSGVSVFLALLVMLSLSLWLQLSTTIHHGSEAPSSEFGQGKDHDLQILKRALSPDEKRILEHVESEFEITQDSLRFRLEWSKAKVSTIVSNLDRMGLIQRRREGKTYVVFLPKNTTKKN